jgi:hypothetical protein
MILHSNTTTCQAPLGLKTPEQLFQHSDKLTLRVSKTKNPDQTIDAFFKPAILEDAFRHIIDNVHFLSISNLLIALETGD